MTRGVHGSAERRAQRERERSRKRKAIGEPSGEGGTSRQRPPQFGSDRAENLYKAGAQRDIIRERNFDLTMNWGEFENERRAIEDQLRARHWESFNGPVDTGSAQLCKEFHCNLCEVEDGKVWVRGKWVDFSAEVINAYFGNPSVPTTPYSDFVESEKDMDMIKDTLCDRQVEWVKSKLGRAVIKFPRQGLTLLAKLWLYFISDRIWGSGAMSFVVRDKALLIYAILTGIPINMGDIIRQGLLESGQSGRPIFYAASLIHHLCQRAGCPINDQELLVHPRGRYDREYVERMVREFARHHPQPQPQPPQHQSMFPLPPGYVLNAPLSEVERNELQGYWTYSQMVMHHNIAVLADTSRGVRPPALIRPPPSPAWHLGPSRGQYYTPPVPGEHAGCSGGAGAAGDDEEDDGQEDME